MSYREKYLKYKEKYFKLKGGFLDGILKKKIVSDNIQRQQEEEQAMLIEREQAMAKERKQAMLIEREQQQKQAASNGILKKNFVSQRQHQSKVRDRKPSALDIARKKIGNEVELKPGHKIKIMYNGEEIQEIILRSGYCLVRLESINESLSNEETIIYDIEILTYVKELKDYVNRRNLKYAYAENQLPPPPPPLQRIDSEPNDEPQMQPRKLERLVLTDDNIVLINKGSIYGANGSTVLEIEVGDYDSYNTTNQSIYVNQSSKRIRICDVKRTFENYTEYISYVHCKEQSSRSRSRK